MGEIASQVRVANDRIQGATREIMLQGLVINELQKACKHEFQFRRQGNACHEHLWNVTYRCIECGLMATTKTKPICEKCLCDLVHTKKNDWTAERERKKPKYQGRMNPPLAFRCPKCRKIHILWHEGD